MENDEHSGPSPSINIPPESSSSSSNANVTSTFRLFKLPPDALEKVIRRMNPIHLLEICQIANNATKELIKSICKDRIDIFVKFDVIGIRIEDWKREKNKKYQVTLNGNGYKNYIYTFEKHLIEKRMELVDRTFGTHKIPFFFEKEKSEEKKNGRDGEDEEDERANESRFDEEDLEEDEEEKDNVDDKITFIHTFWDDIFDGVMQLAVFISDVFDTPITGVFTSHTMSIWKFRQVINWILNRQSTIKFLKYKNNALAEEDISMFFGNCIVTEWLDIGMKPNRTIQNHHNFDLNTLQIGRASWVTLNYLMNMDCIVMNLYGTELTSQDLNNFVKHWLNGGNFRLQLLAVRTMQKFDKEAILDGIEGTERAPHLVTRYKRNFIRGYGYIAAFNGGYDIRRSDGAMATIKVKYGWMFQFMVWTKSEIFGGWNRSRLSSSSFATVRFII